MYYTKHKYYENTDDIHTYALDFYAVDDTGHDDDDDDN